MLIAIALGQHASALLAKGNKKGAREAFELLKKVADNSGVVEITDKVNQHWEDALA